MSSEQAEGCGDVLVKQSTLPSLSPLPEHRVYHEAKGRVQRSARDREVTVNSGKEEFRPSPLLGREPTATPVVVRTGLDLPNPGRQP